MNHDAPPPRNPLSRTIAIVGVGVIAGFIFLANWTATRLESRQVGTGAVRAVSDAYFRQAKEGLVPQPKSGRNAVVVTSTSGKVFYVTVQTEAGPLYYSTRKREGDAEDQESWIFRAMMAPPSQEETKPPLPASEPSPVADGEAEAKTD